MLKLIIKKEQNDEAHKKFASFISAKTTEHVCNDTFMSDIALIQCNQSKIIDIENLITLCELDYDGAPVIKKNSS